ncbi:MAG TPA: hypothetical protein VFA12_19670 [Stellaceae bacterium]|nr:hypothetical protein [Stellaceae bacterium]
MLKYVSPVIAGILAVLFVSQASAQGMEYRYHHWWGPHHHGWYWGNGPWWETPAQNVIRSQRYDHLLQVSLRFRAYRIRKECGPVTDPQLHADCVQSFDVYEPVAAGASWGWWGYGWHHRWHHAHWRRGWCHRC